METSNAERFAGINISYENSFSAIKKDILKETVDKKKVAALSKEVIPIEEVPNKPKEKFAINTMSGPGADGNMNISHEFRPPPAVTVQELLNRTAAQYASSQSASKHDTHFDKHQLDHPVATHKVNNSISVAMTSHLPREHGRVDDQPRGGLVLTESAFNSSQTYKAGASLQETQVIKSLREKTPLAQSQNVSMTASLNAERAKTSHAGT